jgi:hypothetical protein
MPERCVAHNLFARSPDGAAWRLFLFEIYIDCLLRSTTSGWEKFNNSTETERPRGLKPIIAGCAGVIIMTQNRLGKTTRRLHREKRKAQIFHYATLQSR